MSKGSKGLGKAIRSTKKAKAGQKKAAIYKMVEALISKDSENAAIHLHEYLQMKTREIVLGEAEEMEDEKDEKDEKEDDEDEKDENDENEDDEDEKDEKK